MENEKVAEMKELIEKTAKLYSIPLGGTLSNRLLAKAVMVRCDEGFIADLITLALLIDKDKQE